MTWSDIPEAAWAGSGVIAAAVITKVYEAFALRKVDPEVEFRDDLAAQVRDLWHENRELRDEILRLRQEARHDDVPTE